MEQRELTFRVFVSSAFSDLKVEPFDYAPAFAHRLRRGEQGRPFGETQGRRDALQRDVFPRLREYCQKHGCRFQEIDLRWGVSEETAADQSTMRIRRAEIARCQAVTPRKLKFNPFFVGLCLHEGREGWAQQ